MAIVPLRDLGTLGIITDVDPYDLPVNAFSFGKNVRFENGKVERGSVLRTLGPLSWNPSYLFGYTDSTNNPRIITVNRDGGIAGWTPTGHTSLSPATWGPQESEAAVSLTSVNNLIFVNRGDRVPWYRSKDSSGAFQTLPSGAGQWDSSWRAQVITSVAGVVVALNITKGATLLPNDVLWSDFVLYDTPPNWDIASTTGSAGENTLAQMNEPIVDGLALKSRLMIYARTETWFMDYIGGNDMFRFDRQFDKGVISTNCVIETNGMHYVFGSNDIWMHDGVSQKSIAQGRVRRFIFDSLKHSVSEQFFVAHNPDQNEVLFCYVSDDPYIRYPSDRTIGCNRAAIYNYAADTWYFHDLPYVTCATQVTTTSGQSFDSFANSFDSQGGSFASQGGDTNLVMVMGGNADALYNLGRTLRTFAPFNAAATTFPLDQQANNGALLLREGLDLDELNVDLKGYKLASSIYPQGRLAPDAYPLVFTMGSADHPMDTTYWGASQTYDRSFYKLDHNIAGRYLSYKIDQADSKPFSLSGFDFDLTILGER